MTMVKGKYGWEEDQYTFIKRQLTAFFNSITFRMEVIDKCGVTFDEFRNFTLGFAVPNYSQAKKMAKVLKMPLIETYFVPPEHRVSAIDMATGQEIKVEEC